MAQSLIPLRRATIEKLKEVVSNNNHDFIESLYIAKSMYQNNKKFRAFVNKQMDGCPITDESIEFISRYFRFVSENLDNYLVAQLSFVNENWKEAQRLESKLAKIVNNDGVDTTYESF